MSEKKKNPELEEELESVEDDKLQNVAGGAKLRLDFNVKKPGVDEPRIPGAPKPSCEVPDNDALNLKK